MLVLSAAPSSEPCCHLRRTEGASLLWRTSPVRASRHVPAPALAARPRAFSAVCAAARAEAGRLESVARSRAPATRRHSRMKSPTRTLLLVHDLVCALAFSLFFCAAPDFLPEKNSGALSSKTPMPRPQKHQCLHPKTPMPRPQKHQCLRAKTPLPAHPMWPRPSAYTREFRKLTCVGTGPRPYDSAEKRLGNKE